MIYKPTGRRYYRIKFQWNGKTIQKRTKLTTADDARRQEARLRTELAHRHEESVKAAKRFHCAISEIVHCAECDKPFRSDRGAVAVDGETLCGDACREKWDKRCNPVPVLRNFLELDFRPFNETRFKTKPKSRDYYKYGTRLLLASDLALLRLDQITSQHATGFVAKHSNLSPSTVNCSLRTLRRALNLAQKWGKLAKAPDIELAKGERQRDRILTDAEFLAYRGLCRQPWRDVVTLLYGTGMRPGEAYQLRWENVLLNGNSGLIQIAQGKTKAARRLLPMVPEVYRTLTERWEAQGKPAQGWVFPSGSASGHFDENSAKNQHIAARTILQKAGIEPFEPYCLRHTALTRLADAGCDAFTLAKIAGHSSITITQRYCHPQAEAIERAFAKLPPSRTTHSEPTEVVPTGGSHEEQRALPGLMLSTA